MNQSTHQQLSLAERQFRSGQVEAAETLLRQLLARDATVAKAWELLAYISGNRGDLGACEEQLLKASALPGCSAEALFYLGRVQLQQGRQRDAVSTFARSLHRAGDYFEALHEMGVAHSALGEHDRAFEAFRRAERQNSRSPDLQANMGNTLSELRRFTEALAHYDLALALDPARVRAWADRGIALTELGRATEALDSYGRALAMAPNDVYTLMNQATTLMIFKRHAEALVVYETVASLAPDTDYLHGYWLHCRMLLCRWEGWSELLNETLSRVRAGQKAAVPFPLMATPAGPASLLACTRIYAQDHAPLRISNASDRRPFPAGRKLRVAYFSTDFRDHPVAHLMARLFECHDRERFQWFGFSLSPAAPDAMTKRVAAAFDHFANVAKHSDEEIAAMARGAGIDIAVDLNGFTEGARPNIFAHRAAPLQVNFLGYPGSMGCAYIDYILADATIIGADDHCHYTEKVVTVPGCYQPNDDRKPVGIAPTTRESIGLPAHGFVFACFNAHYKITPDVFEVWMRLLRALPGSVLWMHKGNDAVQTALGAEAQSRGVDAERIVWAERVPELADHLARQAHADLFLDTFHYNAHTTCSDALWAGLPVLTMAGPTFASRVAASLLAAAGLPELVTHSVADYEACAMSLATQPERLRALRTRLALHRKESSLFDTPRFARRIEAAFDAMAERHRQGLPPDHLQISDSEILSPRS